MQQARCYRRLCGTTDLHPINRTRLTALDALFFWLYGLGLDDAAYIMDTFPIVRDQDTKAFGCYRTKDDVLAVLAILGD